MNENQQRIDHAMNALDESKKALANGDNDTAFGKAEEAFIVLRAVRNQRIMNEARDAYLSNQ